MSDEETSNGAKHNQSLLRQIVSSFRAEAAKYIGILLVGILFGSSGVFVLLLYKVNNYIDTRILSKVTTDIDEDIKKGDNSEILHRLRAILKKDFDSDGSILGNTISTKMSGQVDDIAGLITFGTFSMTSDKPQAYVDVFAPPAHDAQILFRVEGLVEGKQLISVQLPNSKPRPIKELGVSNPITLADLLQKDPSLPDSSAEISSDKGQFKDIYHLTLTLKAAEEKAKLNTPTAVHVYYIVIVRPPLHKQEMVTASGRNR
jgi:hypothetical protein